MHKATKREVLAAPGNRLQIYDDHTLDYDAWEIEPFHEQTVQDCPPAHSLKVQKIFPLRAEIVFERKIGLCSSMIQTVRLDAGTQRLEFHCKVDWHESHKLLKVFFPTAVTSEHASYEMQFGTVERPTHRNTPYAAAQFEVAGHKWVDLSNQDFGLTILSQYKHGFSVHENEMRLSLLRAPKDPDPNADMGKHEFVYAVMPHSGNWQEAGVVAEAFKFNYPLVWTESRVESQDTKDTAPAQSFAHVNDPNLVLDTIKKAEDSDDIVVRLYECHGAHGTATLRLGFPFTSAEFANVLEDLIGEATITNGTIQIPYKSFEIITLIVH
jgi:alpha-mannosidase